MNQITVKEYLLSKANDISCNKGCGLCCPPRCEKLLPDKTCRFHPSVVGEEDAFWNRGVICGRSPVGLFLSGGVPCPPVVRAVEQLTGETLKIKRVDYPGDIPVILDDSVREMLKWKITIA